MTVAARSAVVPLLVTLGLLAAEALPAAASEAADLWERSLRSGRDVRHTGEILCITWSDAGTKVTTAEVSNSAADLTFDADADALTQKYRLEVVGSDLLLDRPVTRLEIRRRSDDRLRERLWVDDDTGLLLRRERYDGDAQLSLVAYQRLDLEPMSRRREGPRVALANARPTVEPATPVAHGLPDELPGGYRAELASNSRETLRAVYDDGLYRVSLFVLDGRPDWDSLPPGSQPVEGLPGIHEWPGALPARMVWEAEGRTWTLVGDAPPGELHTLVQALPQPDPPSTLRRVRAGLARLWSAVSPWS